MAEINHTLTNNLTDPPVAVVTGASSGIGAAIAKKFSELGYKVILGARRKEKIAAIATEINGLAIPLDVRDYNSVTNFAKKVPKIDVLVNNAGGAVGFEPILETDPNDWRTMWETNVLGTLLVTQAFLPHMLTQNHGNIINITSIAAFSIYENGAGYTSAKHAESALHLTLRKELVGTPIKLTEICPGKVETEFSLVRFKGNKERAAAVYQGFDALKAKDVADIVSFVVSQPPHVNLDRIIVTPLAQADVKTIVKTKQN